MRTIHNAINELRMKGHNVIVRTHRAFDDVEYIYDAMALVGGNLITLCPVFDDYGKEVGFAREEEQTDLRTLADVMLEFYDEDFISRVYEA